MSEQGKLFDLDPIVSNKTYRALRHDVVRDKQNQNSDTVHHPNEKTRQITTILDSMSSLNILELFSGRGNLTSVYSQYGDVDAYDRKWLSTGDSYIQFHKLIAEKKKYHVIDLDPYGFPNRFFPDIFLLIETGYIFITMPKPYVNILNGITQTHLTSYYGEQNPSKEVIVERIANFGICHWRKLELVSELDLKSVWRFAFKVTKVKATEYCNVKNR